MILFNTCAYISKNKNVKQMHCMSFTIECGLLFIPKVSSRFTVMKLYSEKDSTSFKSRKTSKVLGSMNNKTNK